ncbi:hypothetical protein M9458_029687, partial [Cirrhinus mrigala]
EGRILHSAGDPKSESNVEDFGPANLEKRTMRWVKKESESSLVQESESPLDQGPYRTPGAMRRQARR